MTGNRCNSGGDAPPRLIGGAGHAQDVGQHSTLPDTRLPTYLSNRP